MKTSSIQLIDGTTQVVIEFEKKEEKILIQLIRALRLALKTLRQKIQQLDSPTDPLDDDSWTEH